jgi:hypothetical protein
MYFTDIGADEIRWIELAPYKQNGGYKTMLNIRDE